MPHVLKNQGSMSKHQVDGKAPKSWILTPKGPAPDHSESDMGCESSEDEIEVSCLRRKMRELNAALKNVMSPYHWLDASLRVTDLFPTDFLTNVDVRGNVSETLPHKKRDEQLRAPIQSFESEKL